MKRETTINRSSRSSTIISVLMMLLMLFLPLSSWSGYLIIETNESSDMHMMAESDMNSNSMPCHSTPSKSAALDQEKCKGECCDQSGLDSQCGGCTHNCTFVKHFSNAIDSFNLYLTQNHAVKYSASLAEAQFPSPPFRPPAS
jgi:hypothetical protein